MMGELFEDTKLAAYFLWEHSGYANALDLWYCVEDMACYFERGDITDEQYVDNIKALGVQDPGYIEFVRNIAFRVYIYTNCGDALTNWYMAERLLRVGEWVRALTGMAAIYRNEKSNYSIMEEVRSENVRAYYEQTFQ